MLACVRVLRTVACCAAVAHSRGRQLGAPEVEFASVLPRSLCAGPGVCPCLHGAKARVANGSHTALQVLIANRQKIVWCTKLMRAKSDDETAALEREMYNDPALVNILGQLKACLVPSSCFVSVRVLYSV
jgi:N-terminal helicase PWI domain